MTVLSPTMKLQFKKLTAAADSRQNRQGLCYVCPRVHTHMLVTVTCGFLPALVTSFCSKGQSVCFLPTQPVWHVVGFP